MKNHKLSSRSLERLQGVEPIVIQLIKLALKHSLIDFGIPADGGLRYAARQNELYKDGKSKADGYIKLSKHQANRHGYGMAWDVYAYVDGKPSWKESHLAIIAAAMYKAAMELNIDIDWGGEWQRKQPKLIDGIPYGWDMGHFEKVRL